MSLIVFSHANSFPASTYGVLFKSLRSRGYTVKAVDKFGHDPKYPVTNNWPLMVQQLHDLARRETDKAGEPAWLVGHSLGGFLSLMCAARHSELARGVLLIDSPILGGWRATTLGVIKRTQLVGSVSPGAVSRRRKNAWPDKDAVLAHFRHKKAFAKWDAQVLRRLRASHGTRGGGWPMRMLAFDRDVETAIYNTLPAQPGAAAQAPPAANARHTIIGGTRFRGNEARLAWPLTQQVVKGRITMLEGSHLFPMEKPLATAAAIEASLRGMSAND
jgi:pimeloyl-ACP methyl ester carboxylesterase